MSMIEKCSLTDNMTNKAIRDQHRELFAEMVKKTGSQQSVLDRMLQEIQFLRDHEGGPMDEEVIDILRGNVARLERQRDELKLASANALIAEQNKLAKERQEWTLHTSEVIRSLNQQLAAALAACKQKDEALQNCEGMLDELRDYPITHDAIIEALAIQPDDSALKAFMLSKGVSYE